MYCKIGWNKANLAMLGSDDLVGNNILRLSALPIRIVSTPARINLVPANKT